MQYLLQKDMLNLALFVAFNAFFFVRDLMSFATKTKLIGFTSLEEEDAVATERSSHLDVKKQSQSGSEPETVFVKHVEERA